MFKDHKAKYGSKDVSFIRLGNDKHSWEDGSGQEVTVDGSLINFVM